MNTKKKDITTKNLKQCQTGRMEMYANLKSVQIQSQKRIQSFVFPIWGGNRG